MNADQQQRLGFLFAMCGSEKGVEAHIKDMKANGIKLCAADAQLGVHVYRDKTFSPLINLSQIWCLSRDLNCPITIRDLEQDQFGGRSALMIDAWEDGNRFSNTLDRLNTQFGCNF